jgi:site-specific recombinase XerD
VKESPEQVIKGTHNLRHQALPVTAYSMGLQSEELNLEFAHIDSEHHKTQLQLGKGQKIRLVLLPDITLTVHLHHWGHYRHLFYLLPVERAVETGLFNN